MYCGGGNDQIYGNEAIDIIDGGAGADWIYGRQANDTLSGGIGNDNMWGDDAAASATFVDAGDDIMNGNEGNDIMSGGAGNDTMSGGDDSDTMWGNHGDDIMNGDAGLDLMYGNEGADTMHGGTGNDTMLGGDGDDILFGQDCFDQLWGQAGADTFGFEATSAFTNVDVIKDFSTGDGDKIDLSGLVTTYDPITDAIEDFIEITTSGSNSILKVDTAGTGSFGAGTQVATIEGVTGLTYEAALESNGTLVV